MISLKKLFRPKSLHSFTRLFSSRDCYETLGVTRSATDSQLKKAYFKLVKKYHPDQNSSPDAKQKFQEVNSAYETLKDPKKRKHYDTFGFTPDQEGEAPGGFGFGGGDGNQNVDFGGFDFNEMGGGSAGDIFSKMFGGNFTEANGPQKGQNLEESLRISFMEAVKGCSKDIEVNRRVECQSCGGQGVDVTAEQTKCRSCNGKGNISHVRGPMMFQSTCGKCGGSGVKQKPCWTCAGNGVVQKTKRIKVVIPEGVSAGTKVRISGQGHSGPKGGPRGHLFIEIEVEPHPNFERSGADIHYTAGLPFEDAILGGKLRVPTLQGEVLLKAQPGTQPGQTVRMPGKGVKVLNRMRYGDQYVHFNVELPKKLTPKQEELLKAYRSITQGDNEALNKDENLKTEKTVAEDDPSNDRKPRKKKRTKGFFKRILGGD